MRNRRLWSGSLQCKCRPAWFILAAVTGGSYRVSRSAPLQIFPILESSGCCTCICQFVVDGGPFSLHVEMTRKNSGFSMGFSWKWWFVFIRFAVLDNWRNILQALNDLGLNTVAVEGLLGSAALSSFGLASGGKRWEDSLEMAGLDLQ